MTRKALTYIMLLLLVAACGDKERAQYTIKGKVSKEQSKMLIYGLDNRYEKVDSVIANENGRFTYTIDADTIIPLALLIPGNSPIVLYAEPNVKAKLTYDSIANNKWIVEGGPAQFLHDSISTILDACRSDREIRESIESFTKRYPISDVNIEIFRRYLVETPNPDNNQIKTQISKLGGILQDHEYFATIKKNIEKRNSNTLHKLFPSFKYTTADSCKEITLNTFNRKYLLVTFWAPWDEASRKEMCWLREIADSVESKNFEILNIALEYDTANWKKVLCNDSITGHNVCETDAWSSEIANKFNIKALPFSVLVSPYQRIIRFSLDLKESAHFIDSLVTKYDKELEEREKRKAREKKERERRERKNSAKER